MFLVVYAIIGTVVTFGVFGKPLIGLNFQQLRREADFRFSLIRIRENAEAIAFYQGEAREVSQVKQRFAQVFGNYKKLIKRTLGLNLRRRKCCASKSPEGRRLTMHGSD